MHLRLDIGGIVEQQIEDVMAFMFVSTDDAGIEALT